MPDRAETRDDVGQLKRVGLYGSAYGGGHHALRAYNAVGLICHVLNQRGIVAGARARPTPRRDPQSLISRATKATRKTRGWTVQSP